MVWTEVSWLLAAVAGFVVLVAFVAIFLTELGRSDRGSLRAGRRRLPDNADLSDDERRVAMRNHRPDR